MKQIREDFILRQVKYKEQKEIFGNRNSYSKTDKDATFMRMKEDHMKNVKKRNSSIYIQIYYLRSSPLSNTSGYQQTGLRP
ncbi:hypothetical protein EW027_12990 [Aeribacillus pallidus]|uniref:hypothetical protein n=1 Tax=Aeribacillus pallidus TaxID=33936 RepID=UPI001022FD00|nr:hypothetical protein [Aeribacillus pallidus]RZI50880.1 hypothetical protein EW027_12990 [Aeribacillus pallidus]